MKVKDVMETNVISVKPDETIGSALSKMKKNKLNQLPVIGKRPEGMLLLKKIITKDLDPAGTKVTNVTSQMTPVSKEDDIVRAAELIILSGQRALPVVENENVIGIISETDILKVADRFNLDLIAEDIMTMCEYAGKDDDIGKIKKIMVYHNVSRVPIVDGGKIIGVVSTLDLVDVALGRKETLEGGLRRKASKEMVPVEKTPASSVMSEAVVISKSAVITEIAEKLLSYEEVFVEEGGISVVTPKDIIELVAKGVQKGAYVQITNLKGEDPLAVAKIEEKAAELTKKIGHMADIQSFVIHVDRHDKGGKPRYDVRTRLFISSSGLFVSKASGWDLVTLVQEAVDKLEREILKKHDIIAHHEKAKKSKGRLRD